MTHQELRKLRLSLRKMYSEKYGLTQKEMAELLGISLPLYSLYERGQRPMNKTVEKLATKLAEERGLAIGDSR